MSWQQFLGLWTLSFLALASLAGIAGFQTLCVIFAVTAGSGLSKPIIDWNY
jgi:hypothetical protein